LVGEVRQKEGIWGEKSSRAGARGSGGDPKNPDLSHLWDGTGGYLGT
jgi:hypothetical protein